MLPSPADGLTPQEITDLFRQEGLLARGSVADFEYHPLDGQFGKRHELFFLSLRYQGAGQQAPPERLFLKFGKSSKEPFFYTHIAPVLDLPNLLRCYYTAYDPAADRCCLLLEDLSASHYQTEWPLPPCEEACRETLRAIADVHARGWQHPRLEADFRPALPLARTWQSRLDVAIQSLPAFFNFLGDRLVHNRRAIYERIAAAASRPWQVPPGAPYQTLIHGDLHVWNVFYPRQANSDTLRLFDWNMWDIRPAVDDLAYLMALHWYPERRARLERPLLACYHQRLLAGGVTNYTLDQLLRDYRAAILRVMLIPVWQWQRGILPGIWWSHLERGLLAFEDLACQEFL